MDVTAIERTKLTAKSGRIAVSLLCGHSDKWLSASSPSMFICPMGRNQTLIRPNADHDTSASKYVERHRFLYSLVQLSSWIYSVAGKSLFVKKYVRSQWTTSMTRVGSVSCSFGIAYKCTWLVLPWSSKPIILPFKALPLKSFVYITNCGRPNADWSAPYSTMEREYACDSSHFFCAIIHSLRKKNPNAGSLHWSKLRRISAVADVISNPNLELLKKRVRQKSTFFSHVHRYTIELPYIQNKSLGKRYAVVEVAVLRQNDS